MAEVSGTFITIDAREFLGAISALSRPHMDAAVSLALVDVAETAIGRASRAIAQRTGLRVKTVRPRIFRDSIKVGDYQISIRSSRRPIRLIEYPSSRQAAKGVYTRAWGRTQIIKGGFRATMRFGRVGGTGMGLGGGIESMSGFGMGLGGGSLVNRTDFFVRRPGAGRLPIQRLFGPTIAGTFRQRDVQLVVAQTAIDRMDRALRRRVKSGIWRARREAKND